MGGNPWYRLYFGSFYFIAVAFFLSILVAFIIEYTTSCYKTKQLDDEQNLNDDL